MKTMIHITSPGHDSAVSCLSGPTGARWGTPGTGALWRICGAFEPAHSGARIPIVRTTMVPVPIADTAQMRRLIEFASDVTQLADERIDLDLRELIDGLHADLLNLKEDEDG